MGAEYRPNFGANFLIDTASYFEELESLTASR